MQCNFINKVVTDYDIIYTTFWQTLEILVRYNPSRLSMALVDLFVVLEMVNFE